MAKKKKKPLKLVHKGLFTLNQQEQVFQDKREKRQQNPNRQDDVTDDGS